MNWGFEREKEYSRKIDIHGRFGGQEQGGIISPSKARVVIVIASPRGLAHGYHNKERSDGIYEYFGAGRSGDMTLRGRNRSILEHSEKSKSLLLFEETRRKLRFKGEYVLDAYRFQNVAGEDGKDRQAIVFELRPLENLVQQVEAAINSSPPNTNLSIRALRDLAIASFSPPGAGKTALATSYVRSANVKRYILERAGGKCEADGLPAPFLRANGTPYLEPHHILRVSDGGPDDIHHVIALCPNCHRRAHSAVDAQDFNRGLLAKVAAIERVFESEANHHAISPRNSSISR